MRSGCEVGCDRCDQRGGDVHVDARRLWVGGEDERREESDVLLGVGRRI